MTQNCTKIAYSLSTRILRKSILTLVLFYTLILSSQNTKIDSLENLINTFESSSEYNVRDTTYINNLVRIGNALRYYNTDRLFGFSTIALKNSKAANYTKGEVNALIAIGTYYSDQGRHDKGIEFFEKALKISKNAKNSRQILKSKIQLSGEYSYLGNYAKALEGFLDASEYAMETNEKLMLSIVQENIANLYISQKDYKQGIHFYEKAKKINSNLNQPIHKAETMVKMASSYADMEKLEYAMFNVNAGIAIFEKEKKIDWLAYAYEIKGKIYLNKKKYKWALYWYNQSELLHKNLQDDRGEIDLLNGKSEAYLGQNRDSIAQEYALKAYDLSRKLKFKEGIQKCAKTLYKINKYKKDFETALAYHELFQVISDTLSTRENQKGLTMLKTKIEHDRQKEALIENNRKALAEQKSYVYSALFILLIFIVITLLIRRNEKIQKNLNIELNTKKQDLEKTEINLREINTTKDKLFSIIGHDLRGPIGAFQGLLDMFKKGEIGKDEFLDFVPKLKSDIDHISFTLNNLLSWGQSQMNGSSTKPTNTHLCKLVKDNVNLLSETATHKSITLINQIPDNILSWIDANQIDIVIRNLISNALKFTPENGSITVGLMEKSKHIEVYVKDTGIGMDIDTQKQIFAKNSSLTTYGTNNEKGTGLGLSLCKEMVEKNDGKIWVTSRLGKGSCFYFTIPKAKNNLKKIA